MSTVSPDTSARIVVVDDHAPFRTIVRLLLERERFEVVAEAADGTTGLEAVRQHAPDLVITDLQMPRGDGFDLAAAIRGVAPDVLVVLITGVDGPDLEERARAVGISLVLHKGPRIEELVPALRALLGASS